MGEKLANRFQKRVRLKDVGVVDGRVENKD
jgi:hypothetical protein